MKYGFIARHRSVWPTRTMCRVLAVSHSGFYEWMDRAPSQRSQDDARLTRLIRESFELSDRTYGSPRVWHDLRALGESCGMNRVIRLMHLAKLQARHKRRRLPGDTGSRLENHIAPNHLQRDFEAIAPNQKWVADFTYIWTAEGWLYAAAVMDLYSRRIVGWSMSDTMQAKMVSDALLMALWRRGKPSSLMHHSDQGSQGGFNRSSQHWVVERILDIHSRLLLVSSNRAFSSVSCSAYVPRPGSRGHSIETGLCPSGSIAAGVHSCSRSCRAAKGCEGQQRRRSLRTRW